MRTLQDVVRSIARHADAMAVHAFDGGGERWSFARLAGEAERLARGLVAAGAVPGPVGVFGPGRPEWIAAALAVLEAGGTLVPLDAQADDEQLAHLVRDSGVTWVFTVGRRADRLEALDAGRPLRPVLVDATRDDSRSWHHLLAAGGSAPAGVRPEDRALLLYTAGTTGRAKGVPLTHANCTANLRALLETRLVGRDDRVLLPLPLHHVYPFMIGLLAPLAAGAAVVIPAGLTGPEVVRALTEGDVTTIVGVPRFYAALLAGLEGRVGRRGRVGAAAWRAALAATTAARRRLGLPLGRWVFRPLRRRFGPRVRLVASGGARLDPRLAWKLEGLGWTVCTGYGLTETSPILTFNVTGRRRIETVGRPVVGVEVRIREPGPEGEGEVVARGPSVFGGYHNLPDETGAAFTPDGWFRTGDLGRFDRDGYLTLTGRATERIVLPGGENVTPEEVEHAYERDPALAEVGVLEREGRLAAVIRPERAEVRRQGRDPETAVRAAVEARGRRLRSTHRIGHYAITRQPLPRTRLGKLRRHLLADVLARASRGEDRTRRAARGPVAIDTLAADDRALLREPAARQVWDWLADRFPDRRLEPDTSPGLDLGIDSLEWLNLTLELRERAGVDLGEEALGRAETVRDLLRAASDAGPAPAAAGDPLEDPERALTDDQRRWLRPAPGALAGLSRLLFAVNRAVVRLAFRLRVDGLDRLPGEGAVVLAPNHRSYLDPFVLAAALPLERLRRTYWGGAATVLFGNPLTRAFSRAAGVFPVDPEHAARSSLVLGATVLARGQTLVWFPEGQRSPTGELGEFRPGIGVLVDRFRPAVVPVFIDGTQRALPPGRRRPSLARVTVAFGAPRDAAELTARGDPADARARIARRLRDEVAALGRRAA